MEEIWKNVNRFDGVYQISNLGNVRALDRLDAAGRRRKGKVLKLQQDMNGYMRVRVSFEAEKYTMRIHREVALAFIPNVEDKEQVNHIDGDKTNNQVENLEWCTSSENQKHAVDTGLRVHEKGSKASRFVSPVKVYDMDMNFLYELKGNAEMVEKGFDYRLVSAVVRGKRNHHKKHKFRRD